MTANIQLTLEDIDDTGSNGSIATAEEISVNTSVMGDAGLDPNFADYYSFAVDTSGEVTLALTGLQDDLRIDLFNSDGVRVGQAQNAGTADELLVQSIPAGTYFIGVVAQTSVDASPYDLSVAFNVPDASYTLSSATTFGGFPLDVTQTVGSGSDSADYYSFVPAADGTVQVDLTGLTAIISVQGFNQNGVRIADSSLGNMLDKSITFEVIGGQTYYLGAIPASDGAAGTYTLEAAYAADAGNALATPSNVDVNFSRIEAIGFNGDTDDNFRIVPADAGTLTVNLTEVSSPVDLHLYTTDGTRVAMSRNAGNADEQISFNLEANVAYVIAVTPTSSAAQGFYDINSSFSVSSSAQSAATVAIVDQDQVGS